MSSDMDRRELNAADTLLSWEAGSAGQIVLLTLPDDLAAHFSKRLNDAKSRFVRFAERHGHRPVHTTARGGTVLEACFESPVPGSALSRLDRRLAQQIYRPLSSREAARFLLLDRQEFRDLHREGAILPCGTRSADRYGRRYSYPLFSVRDLVRLKDRLIRCTDRQGCNAHSAHYE